MSLLHLFPTSANCCSVNVVLVSLLEGDLSMDCGEDQAPIGYSASPSCSGLTQFQVNSGKKIPMLQHLEQALHYDSPTSYELINLWSVWHKVFSESARLFSHIMYTPRSCKQSIALCASQVVCGSPSVTSVCPARLEYIPSHPLGTTSFTLPVKWPGLTKEQTESAQPAQTYCCSKYEHRCRPSL